MVTKTNDTTQVQKSPKYSISLKCKNWKKKNWKYHNWSLLEPMRVYHYPENSCFGKVIPIGNKIYNLYDKWNYEFTRAWYRSQFELYNKKLCLRFWSSSGTIFGSTTGVKCAAPGMLLTSLCWSVFRPVVTWKTVSLDHVR